MQSFAAIVAPDVRRGIAQRLEVHGKPFPDVPGSQNRRRGLVPTPYICRVTLGGSARATEVPGPQGLPPSATASTWYGYSIPHVRFDVRDLPLRPKPPDRALSRHVSSMMSVESDEARITEKVTFGSHDCYAVLPVYFLLDV